MGLLERSSARKRAKELRSELKQLKKDMISGGCEKNMADSTVREFLSVVEDAAELYETYQNAMEHLQRARRQIVTLLECMNESPVSEVKQSFLSLIGNLEQIYHECLIRQDDMDFQSTFTCLNRMVQEFDGQNTIMLRSELENAKAVLDDASGWIAPDFPALAYYFAHEERGTVADMECSQRNEYILRYFEEHFIGQFLTEAEHAGVKERVYAVIQEYVYGKADAV